MGQSKMTKHIRFWVALLLAMALLPAEAADRYNAQSNQLSIAQVAVGQTVYADVVITVGQVLAVNQGAASGTMDVYDATRNQLTIPSVFVGDTQYTNVLISVGQVLSVGASMDLATATQLFVPTDVSAIAYPASYQQAVRSNASLVTDPCKTDMAEVTYPKSWMGSYGLPQVVGAPLKRLICEACTSKTSC
jgi:hypothetical protein